MSMWVCPHCWGEDLDYGAIEIEWGDCYYPRTCENCWTRWNEWYELSYCEQEVVSYPDDLSDNQKKNEESRQT